MNLYTLLDSQFLLFAKISSHTAGIDRLDLLLAEPNSHQQILHHYLYSYRSHRNQQHHHSVLPMTCIVFPRSFSLACRTLLVQSKWACSVGVTEDLSFQICSFRSSFRDFTIFPIDRSFPIRKTRFADTFGNFFIKFLLTSSR